MFSPSQVRLLKTALTNLVGSVPTDHLQSQFGRDVIDQIEALEEYIDVLVEPVKDDDTTMSLANLIADMDEILERYKN